MKRCLLIINPSSGQRTIQNSLDKLTGQLILQQLVNHIDIFYTQKKDDAYNHVLNVDEKNYDFRGWHITITRYKKSERDGIVCNCS